MYTRNDLRLIVVPCWGRLRLCLSSTDECLPANSARSNKPPEFFASYHLPETKLHRNVEDSAEYTVCRSSVCINRADIPKPASDDSSRSL